MEAFRALQRANAFPCSFACEVEFHCRDRAPAHSSGRATLGSGGLHVACQAVSHSLGRDSSDRENALKRAVTNAYLSLFQHLAIIRTKEGRTYVRAFD